MKSWPFTNPGRSDSPGSGRLGTKREVGQTWQRIGRLHSPARSLEHRHSGDSSVVRGVALRATCSSRLPGRCRTALAPPNCRRRRCPEKLGTAPRPLRASTAAGLRSPRSLGLTESWPHPTSRCSTRSVPATKGDRVAVQRAARACHAGTPSAGRPARQGPVIRGYHPGNPAIAGMFSSLAVSSSVSSSSTPSDKFMCATSTRRAATGW